MNFNWENKREVKITFMKKVNGKNKTETIKVKSWKTRKERRRR